MKKILFVVTNVATIGTAGAATGYEFSEVADAYEVLRARDFQIDFASPNGGHAPESGYDESQAYSRQFRNREAFGRLERTLPLADIRPEDYSALYFPGGLGPMTDLADNAVLADIILSFFNARKVIAAVCHGTVALLHVRLPDGQYLVRGRRLTSFTRAEEVLKEHTLGAVIPFYLDEALRAQGANFRAALPFTSHVVTDGQILTGQNPASTVALAEAIIQKIGV